MDVPDARIKLPWQPNDSAGWRSGREKAATNGSSKRVCAFKIRQIDVSAPPFRRGNKNCSLHGEKLQTNTYGDDGERHRCPAGGAEPERGRPSKKLMTAKRPRPRAILSTFSCKHEALIGKRRTGGEESFISHRHRCNLRLITFAGLGRGHLHCGSGGM